MVEPRKSKDIQRIIRRAKTKAAEADLREYDRLLGERIDYDPTVEPNDVQRKARAARERRLRLLGRRLLKASR
jgi:hypothetical protein